MGSHNDTISKQQLRDGKLLGGMQKNQASLPPSWNLLGTVYTLVQVMAIVQSRLSLWAAAEVAKAAWEAAVQAAREKAAGTKPVVDAVRKQLLVWYANAPDTLADYGMTAPRRAHVKPATKVVAAQKAKQTRAARHTMGSKKRKTIKGAVAETVSISTATDEVTPPPAPAEDPSAAGSPKPPQAH